MGVGLRGTRGQPWHSWDPPSISNPSTHTHSAHGLLLQPKPTLFFPLRREGNRALYSTVSFLRAQTVSVS